MAFTIVQNEGNSRLYTLKNAENKPVFIIFFKLKSLSRGALDHFLYCESFFPTQ